MPSVAAVVLNVSFLVAQYQYGLVIRTLSGQRTRGQPHTLCPGYLIVLLLCLVCLQSPPRSSRSELLRGLTGILCVTRNQLTFSVCSIM